MHDESTVDIDCLTSDFGSSFRNQKRHEIRDVFWFLPALSGLYLFDMQRSGGAVFCALFAGIIAYALLAQFHPQKQFLHDRICGTRLVTWRRVKSPGI